MLPLLDRINLKPFVRSTLPRQEDDENLRTEHTTSFTETLVNRV